MRLTATTLLSLALLLGACGDDKAPAAGGDAGGPRDAGSMDAGGDDAGSPDAGVSDAGPTDAGAPDADVTDGGGSSDAGGDAGAADAGAPSDAGPDPCSMLWPGTPCSSGSACPAGQACVPTGCGDMACIPAGRPCVDASDCPGGSDCVDDVCGRSSGCGDSRDCPWGFACEAGSCVDRRIACEPGSCPLGMGCVGDLGVIPFCLPVATRCSNDGACFMGQCVDVDGDGATECTLPGTCTTNADCSGTQVCGIPMPLAETECGDYGPCAGAADCGTGFECRDLWGDGVRHCVPSGGSCAASSECAAGSLCGVPAPGSAPTCL